MRVDTELLRQQVAALLEASGYPVDRAELVALSLVDAEARGIASHGVSRTRIYSERARAGLVDPTARAVVSGRPRPCRRVDVANGPGQAGAAIAVEEAIQAAKRWGIAMVGVVNSNHCGTLAFFLRQVAAEGLVAIGCSNAPLAMAYFGGRTSAVGTNPFGYAIPRPDGPPIVLDMATSVVAKGVIIQAAKTGRAEIPEGWAVDADGAPARTPAAALTGAVLPFGGPKGSGLAMGIDLLCGSLLSGVAGAAVGDLYADWSRAQRIGHLFIAIDPEWWVGRAEFAANVEAFVAAVHALAPADGHERVLLPGEVEEQRAAVAARDGVTLPEPIAVDLIALAGELGARVLLRD